MNKLFIFMFANILLAYLFAYFVGYFIEQGKYSVATVDTIVVIQLLINYVTLLKDK